MPPPQTHWKGGVPASAGTGTSGCRLPRAGGQRRLSPSPRRAANLQEGKHTVSAPSAGRSCWGQIPQLLRPTGQGSLRPGGAEVRWSTGAKGLGGTRAAWISRPRCLCPGRGTEHGPLCAVGTGPRAGSARKMRCQHNMGFPQSWREQELQGQPGQTSHEAALSWGDWSWPDREKGQAQRPSTR